MKEMLCPGLMLTKIGLPYTFNFYDISQYVCLIFNNRWQVTDTFPKSVASVYTSGHILMGAYARMLFCWMDKNAQNRIPDFEYLSQIYHGREQSKLNTTEQHTR